uniref:Sulfatase-like hydrolase/transferase n=1 Tax=Roseihalotalea indica TaxID=2867963 RepID=A0AA49GNZ7_9BACT|nr:sulfatase-like hydrolase/transferase [Tunicatimonas sp. TK19036]
MIIRRSSCVFLFLWLVSTSFAQNSPNILLIMSDDQGWGDLHLHGNKDIRTPVLDALGKESLRFERFYVSPVCAPTRASLLTGRDYLRTNTYAVTGRGVAMRSEEVTIAEILKSYGYRTGIFGKWHNGEQYPNHPLGQGFDEFLGFCGGHWNRYFDPTLEHNGEKQEYHGYITDILTDAAIKFIEESQDAPFFCYVPYNVPHAPFQVADHYVEQYKAAGYDDKTAAVYGMIENMDENIGRLLHKLDSMKQTDNTIVIFLTDNGPNGHRYNGDMKGVKASVDEGGVRVPCFIRYPKELPTDTLVRQNTAHIDLLPTLVELAGFSVPDTLALDGKSLLPLLKGNSESWPDRLLFTHYSGKEVTPRPGGIRTDRYRLVMGRNGENLLYDMIKDPGQKQSIAEERTALTDSLVQAYQHWYQLGTEHLEELPIPLGYSEMPKTVFPAHEAQLSPGLHYQFEQGYTNDWITDWNSTDNTISWPMEVITPGEYRLMMEYTCSPDNAGSTIEATVGTQTVRATIDTPFPLEIISVPNQTPPVNHVDAHWKKIPLGTVYLEKGRHSLTLRAVQIPGDGVGQFKSIIMEME